MELLWAYSLRIAPGLALALVLLALLRAAPPGARLCVHLASFVLMRDAMTPLGMWQISAVPVFWLRLSSDRVVLLALAASTVGIVLLSLRFEPELARGVTWLRGPSLVAIGFGCLCAMLIAAPVLAISVATPPAARGGAVGAGLLGPLLAFSLCGNAYEELLFRGFLQGLVTPQLGAARAMWVAGVTFGFGHVFLATTVTDIGPVVLGFALYEGLICAALCRHFGLLASVLAHGGGIFLIASGLI